MLDFIIVSLPRSGSTWAANWLTTDATTCAHDPLYTTHYSDFHTQLAKSGKVSGVACTGTGWLWPAWVEAQPVRKLILRRPVGEVQAGLSRIGWPPLPEHAEDRLAGLSGWHVPYTDLFDPVRAAAIWHYLTGRPFDAQRHNLLKRMKIEPQLDQLVTDPVLEARLVQEIA